MALLVLIGARTGNTEMHEMQPLSAGWTQSGRGLLLELYKTCLRRQTANTWNSEESGYFV